MRSEAAFEQFCQASGFTFARLATASDQGEQRPDYRVTGHDQRGFFAEIKEVTPNGEEATAIQTILRGEVGTFATTPGARMREYIAKANPQLRAITHGASPGVLVVYNDNPFLRYHTDPYAVLTAMRGLDVVPVLVPRDPHLSPEFQDVRSGPKKRMTPRANTSIAAILTLVGGSGERLVASIYHNRHASSPLPHSSMVGDALTHYCMTEDERGWDSCTPAV
jgi:hypothetical protein